jgi:predicted nucleic acid-binding protein
VATTREVERQYWDSCLFIDFAQDTTPGGSERSKIFKELVRTARAGGSVILLSNIVLAEVRIKNPKNGEHKELLHELLEVDRPFVQFYAVTREIALCARDEGGKHNLQVMDSIHVATSIIGKADVLFTYDGTSKKSKNDSLLSKNMLIGNPLLRVEVPNVNAGPYLTKSAKNRISNHRSSDSKT